MLLPNTTYTKDSHPCHVSSQVCHSFFYTSYQNHKYSNISDSCLSIDGVLCVRLQVEELSSKAYYYPYRDQRGDSESLVIYNIDDIVHKNIHAQQQLHSCLPYSNQAIVAASILSVLFVPLFLTLLTILALKLGGNI